MSSSGDSSRHDLPDPETDPRFPSGKWRGFWLQQHYAGRQWMNVELAFRNGTINGSGTDRVGRFTISGTYDLKSGRCPMTKSYVGAHSVQYDGRNEGDGAWIWGIWTLKTLDRGGFHLWPAGEEDPTQKRLKAAADTRGKRKRRINLPSLVGADP